MKWVSFWTCEKWMMSAFPAATSAHCAVTLLFYEINQQTEIQMADELAERRKAYSSSTAAIASCEVER
jgi:Na+/melibiose symporter-like transporter